jgi:nucleoside-diphosphate-sugar epimerase
VKVLILGGTGAMGAHLVRLLSDDGVEVTVTSRSRGGTQGLVRYLQGSAMDPAFLDALLREPWDAIVDFMVYSTASFAGRVAPLLNATSQYIFISSARVYADAGQPITEDSPRLLDVSTDPEYLASDEYALTKARQEDLLRDCGRRNWTIIRPYITYSDIRLQCGVLEKEDWLYRALHGRTIVFSSDIAARWTTLTHGLDVARGIQAIVGRPAAMGQAFHITAPEPLKWERVSSIYADTLEHHFGTRPRVLMASLSDFSKTHLAQHQIRYDRLFYRIFDNTKISSYLDPASFVDAETGLRKCLGAFLLSPKFGHINWKTEAAKDRLAGESAALVEISGIKQRIKYLLRRHVTPSIH